MQLPATVCRRSRRLRLTSRRSTRTACGWRQSTLPSRTTTRCTCSCGHPRGTTRRTSASCGKRKCAGSEMMDNRKWYVSHVTYGSHIEIMFARRTVATLPIYHGSLMYQSICWQTEYLSTLQLINPFVLCDTEFGLHGFKHKQSYMYDYDYDDDDDNDY